MLAYNPIFISNLSIVKKSKQWFSKQLISAEQMAAVLKKYNTEFYSPNLFVKIGLFIFTAFVIASAFGFLVFMLLQSNFKSSSEDNINAILTIYFILFSILCLVALEYFIKNNKLYKAGVDECLLYSTFLFGYYAIETLTHKYYYFESDQLILICIVAIPFFIAAIVRYADRLVALSLIICIYTICFLLLLKLGDIAKLIMPFALMLLSIPIYAASKKQQKNEVLVNYWECFVVFEYIALLVFYLAGNYFVIRESSIQYFDLKLNPGEDIPLAFVFYIFTAIVPLLYVYFGLKKKDKILLWTGLTLVVAAALTFKNYFSLGHPEITLTITGAIMIVIAYLSIKALKIPKYGITFEEAPDEDNFLKSNIEAILIAQDFGQRSQVAPDVKFGGGDYGGGGSGGSF